MTEGNHETGKRSGIIHQNDIGRLNVPRLARRSGRLGPMAFSYQTDKGTWTLYNREVQLNGGRLQTIYFFSRGAPKSGAPAELPPGFSVKVVPTTGLPILKRSS